MLHWNLSWALASAFPSLPAPLALISHIFEQEVEKGLKGLNLMGGKIIVVRIEFPALDSLVAYLNSNAQAQIDSITAKLKAEMAGLHSSTSDLQKAVDDAPHT